MTIAEISRPAFAAGVAAPDISSEGTSASVHSIARGFSGVNSPSALADRENLADMLTSAQRGDAKAFAQLYRQTSPAIFGAILRIVNRRDEAEDILHDVYMALWQRSAVYDAQRGDVLPWILTIARHRAISHLRKHKHLPLDEALMSSLSSDGPLPADLNEKKRELQRLQHALTVLPVQQRQAITVAYFGGFSYTELAQTLGVPEGTAKSWIRRGIAKLRQVLED